MPQRSRPAAPLSPPPFRFLAGDPSLDLVNTIDWIDGGPANDRLRSYADLVAWGKGAGVIDAGQARRLLRSAGRRPRAAEKVVRSARSVRAVLQALFASAVAGGRDERAWVAFQRLLSEAYGHLGVAGQGRLPARWTWSPADELEAPLWPAVGAAADLLTSSEAARIRMCHGAGCGWLYVDRSRNHLRRWCDMRTCGTQAKNVRRRST